MVGAAEVAWVGALVGGVVGGPVVAPGGGAATVPGGVGPGGGITPVGGSGGGGTTPIPGGGPGTTPSSGGGGVTPGPYGMITPDSGGYSGYHGPGGGIGVFLQLPTRSDNVPGMVVRLINSFSTSSVTPMTPEGSLSRSTITVWQDFRNCCCVISSEAFFTMTDPEFTVTCARFSSRTSTKKSAASSVGITATTAVDVRIANDDGGVVFGSRLTNRPIPCPS